MVKLTQSRKIHEFLKKNPGEKFNARQLAEAIVKAYPADYQKKRRNPRFANESAFFGQIVAEIGAQREQITKHDPHIFYQDKPRPRLYWYDPDRKFDEVEPDIIDENEDVAEHGTTAFSEYDLYPQLMQYLETELGLYSLRIDEKTSKKSHGTKGGNDWLHPDIVAMQPMDTGWDRLIRDCLEKGAGQRVRLWSFEVKKDLSRSNVRKSFFQAVSNSSWANEGYLVAATIYSTKDNAVEKELKMLSALHGIGVIFLDTENPAESEMMFPSKSRPEVDWESVNRILQQNKDFKNYIKLVLNYYKSGEVISSEWNKY